MKLLFRRYIGLFISYTILNIRIEFVCYFHSVFDKMAIEKSWVFVKQSSSEIMSVFFFIFLNFENSISRAEQCRIILNNCRHFQPSRSWGSPPSERVHRSSPSPLLRWKYWHSFPLHPLRPGWFSVDSLTKLDLNYLYFTLVTIHFLIS